MGRGLYYGAFLSKENAEKRKNSLERKHKSKFSVRKIKVRKHTRYLVLRDF